MTKLKYIIKRIEQFAPRYLAESWDPIGLAFGSEDKEVSRMLIALDLDANTLKEAKEKEVDFIFTHHPSIFSALNTLNEHDARRREYIELIRANIALYSAHTNIDAAEDGMNDWLAEQLNLQKPYEVIDVGHQNDLKLLVLYTPLDHAQQMRRSLHEIGAGQVGDYKNVSYTSNGLGHFTPQAEANPTIGQQNNPETVEEERAEILFPSSLLGKVIQTIYASHPYEEPVYHIMDIGKKGKAYGLGRIGQLKEPQSFEQIIDKVKSAFNLSNVRCANFDLNKPIQKVAILGGSGEKYFNQASNKGADLYITGDISYHGAQDMIREGLAFIDIGHFAENIFVEKMTKKLNEWNKEESWEIEVIPAESQEDVFKFY